MKIAMLRVSRTMRGAETYMLALSGALAERGHEVVVISRDESPLLDMAHAQGLGAVGADVAGDLNLAAPARLARLLSERRFDVVHAHGTHGVLWGCLAAHRAGVRAVVTFHTPLVSEGGELRRSGLGRLAGRWGRPSLILADHIIAVSECSRSYLIARGFAPERISTVPNGIEVARYGSGDRERVRAELGIGEDAVVFGFLGALIADKQPMRVLEAFRDLGRPTCHLVMAGEGPLRQACEARIAERGLSDRVHLVGFRSDTPDVLASFDCLIAPSLREGMPMTFLEAMAAGLPIIASPVGGVPELVTPDTGTLLSSSTAEALADAMARYADDAELRRNHGRAALARVSSEFTIARNAERVEAVLRRMAL